jgi:Outer membrane protein beta-barrel domain
MSVCGVKPLLRRASVLALPAVIAISISASTAVYAQVSTSTADASNGFSSSTDAVASNDGAASSLSAAVSAPDPAPKFGAGGAGQSNGGYYSSGSGNNWTHRVAFEAGGGFNAPIGNDKPFITWGGNINVGGGLKFGRHVSLLAEYQFIDDKLPGSLIADAGADGGYAHIWSLTLDPVIYLFPAHKNDLYVTGGGGFYRKVTSFTDPQVITQCYYFCVTGVENVVVSHFSSNQGGANLGVGFTHRLGGADESLKAFAEVRYLWIDTPRIGEENGLGTTGLVPVTFGVRW